MQSLQKPSPQTISLFLAPQRQLDFSYPEIGFTEKNQPVKGYDNDHQRVLLGQGREAWEAACLAIGTWKMFPGGWARIAPESTPVRQGETLAMVVRLFGLHWVNACRIVYTIAEERRYGLAYGTLPGHIECGEERFSVEWLEDGTVWYDLKAFSHPRLWLVKLGYPVARRLQRRFVRESQAAMQRAVQEGIGKL